MKHFNITILLTLLMSMVGARALAYDACIDGIYYSFSGSNATVTYFKDMSYTNGDVYKGNLVIPESVIYNEETYPVTAIGARAFWCCTSLVSITIPTSVTTIYSEAFCGCNGLVSITIPTSVTSIGSNAFSGCDGLVSITIPSSVVSIAEDAFSWCRNLASISVDAGNMYYDSRNNCNAIIKKSDNTLIRGCKNTTIPSGVTSIGRYAFSGCRGTNSITIPDNITSIDSYAFDDCFSILTILAETPPAITTNEYTFGSQMVIRVPDASVSIYKTANNWSNYASRIFGIGTKIDYDESVNVDNSHSALHEVIGEENLQNVVSLKVTGDINGYDIMVLRNKMDNLHYLDLSDANIVANPYEYYTGHHTSDNILGAYSFHGLEKLVSVKIPKTVKTIGSNAFSNCKYLREVELPQGLEKINTYAFGGSYYNNGQAQIEEIVIPFGVTYIGEYAFGYNEYLKRVALPSTLKYLGSGAFTYCNQLESISIPTSLENIPDRAFFNCRSLTRVDIPSTITSIGNNAFGDCMRLNDVYTYIVEPTPINMNTFSTYTTATLHVPSTSYYNYWYDTEWSQFHAVEEFMAEYQYFYINNDFTIGDEKGTISAGLGQDDPDADLNGGSGLIVESSTYNKQYLDEMHIKAWGENCASVITANNLDAEKVYFDIDILANRWYFLSFPFNVKKANITTPGDDYTFREYSAEERANASTGWQSWTADMLEKGKGYIFKSPKGDTLTLCVEKADNGISWAAENRPLTLTSAPADDAQDASWNFLGNPQTSYYDIDKTGYTQPITVWNGSGYEAVRAEDDAYALKPFEAFFVQKPNSTSEIQFPADGRYTQTQWEQEKTTKAAARRLEGVKTDRLLVNLVLTDGQEKDKTRVVFNEKTSKDYEIDCDAVKFMSSERVPQLYTIDQRKTRYAINERPMGEVRLGYKAINKGELTIKAMRMDQPVMLRDNLLQITHDLSIGDYTFTTEAGTNESRFMLVVDNSATNVGKLRQETGVSVMADEGGISFLGISEEPVNVYSIGGVLMAGNVSNGFLSLPKATYLVKVGTETAKVIVR